MQLMRTMREHILADTWLPFYQCAAEMCSTRGQLRKCRDPCHRADAAQTQVQRGRYEVCAGDVGFIRDMTSGEVMHPVRRSGAGGSFTVYGAVAAA